MENLNLNRLFLDALSPILQLFSGYCVPVILGLFFYWLFDFFRKFREQRKVLEDATNAIIKAQNDEVFRGESVDKNMSEEDRKACENKLLEEIEETVKLGENENILYEPWGRFLAELVGDQVGDQFRLFRKERAKVFFSVDSLLTEALNLRFWNSISSVLVGIGVLGTFAGLTLGIDTLYVEIQRAEGKISEEALLGLLGGMSPAFISSVLGMFTSIVFGFARSRALYSLEKQIGGLQNHLDQVFAPHRKEN